LPSQAEGVPNKGWVRLTSLDSCTGEASVSNRKGKRILAYELDVQVQDFMKALLTPLASGLHGAPPEFVTLVCSWKFFAICVEF
jgi:hypothetical protein